MSFFFLYRTYFALVYLFALICCDVKNIKFRWNCQHQCITLFWFQTDRPIQTENRLVWFRFWLCHVIAIFFFIIHSQYASLYAIFSALYFQFYCKPINFCCSWTVALNCSIFGAILMFFCLVLLLLFPSFFSVSVEFIFLLWILNSGWKAVRTHCGSDTLFERKMRYMFCVVIH